MVCRRVRLEKEIAGKPPDPDAIGKCIIDHTCHVLRYPIQAFVKIIGFIDSRTVCLPNPIGSRRR